MDFSESPSTDLGNFFVKIVDVQLVNEKKEPTKIFPIASAMEIIVKYEQRNKNITQSEFGFHIFRNDGVDCYGTNTLMTL